MFQPGANMNIGGAFTGRSQPMSNTYHPMDDEMDCLRDFEMQVQPDGMQYIETYREAGSDQFLIQAPEAFPLSAEQIVESHEEVQQKASNSVHNSEELTLEL